MRSGIYKTNKLKEIKLKTRKNANQATRSFTWFGDKAPTPWHVFEVDDPYPSVDYSSANSGYLKSLLVGGETSPQHTKTSWIPQTLENSCDY